jgi:DNA-binding beta-propeller fold protein YncE
MEDNGFIVQSRGWLNRVPPEFESLSIGSVFSTVFSPSEWYDGFRFILFRELEVAPVPEQFSAGYTFRLSNQMNPSAGPFDLETGQTLGPGTSLGQVSGPTGIALSNDGQTIYVVDGGNQRIQRFSRNGAFLGAWSAEDDQRIGLGWFDPASQGASDIIVGPDNLIYIADTWNHRIIILDAEGNLVRELGRSGEITDTGNSTDPSVSPGLFYGPRSLAIADGELYVTDTGNERVQVFASDGTFLRAFGGTGSEPGQLLEPVGIAIGPDGNVYVADTGNARISVFTTQGEAVTQIPMPTWEGQIGQQSFLRFDANGILYITTPTTGTIQAWNGAELVPVSSEGAPTVTAPVGMAIDQDGTMLVTETSTSRIIQFPIVLPDGFASSATGATPGASSPVVASPVATEGTPAPDDEASPPAVG